MKFMEKLKKFFTEPVTTPEVDKLPSGGLYDLTHLSPTVDDFLKTKNLNVHEVSFDELKNLMLERLDAVWYLHQHKVNYSHLARNIGSTVELPFDMYKLHFVCHRGVYGLSFAEIGNDIFFAHSFREAGVANLLDSISAKVDNIMDKHFIESQQEKKRNNERRFRDIVKSH